MSSYKKCIYCRAPLFPKHKFLHCDMDCYEEHLAKRGKCVIESCTKVKSELHKESDFCSSTCRDIDSTNKRLNKS